MPLAAGLFKQVAYKAETTYGTVPAAANAQALRRVQSTLDLAKDTYQSNEIRADYQIQDFRHGVRRVRGKIGGELSAGTYRDFFAAALKRDFVAVTAATGASLTIAGTGPTYTVTRAAGSYLTDGFKVGMGVRLSAGALNAANLNKNLLIVALTATVATVMPMNAAALVAEGPITGCTVTAVGKVTYIPQTGHTDRSFSMEHWYVDLGQSEVFSGCKIDQLQLALPATGLATIDLNVLGQGVTTAAAQYFTAPTAPTTTSALAAVNGLLRVGGQSVAIVTSLSLNINPGFSGDPVVGSTVVPNLFPGTVSVSGQLSAYFDTPTLRDVFFNETEIDLIAAFTADNTAAADFISLHLPRIKLGGAAKSDGQGGIVQTLPFQALLNVAGGTGTATEKTTLQIQDTQA